MDVQPKESGRHLPGNTSETRLTQVVARHHAPVQTVMITGVCHRLRSDPGHATASTRVPGSAPLFRTEDRVNRNERLKADSHYLRGTIEQDLEDELSGGFDADNHWLIRFHGIYEQDDRDLRAERKAQKLGQLKQMMLRCRLPGGHIMPAQWLAIDAFARQHSRYGSLRLTARQSLQLHGVPKTALRAFQQLLHGLGLDTLATAGDVNANVSCGGHPSRSRLHRQAHAWATTMAARLLPRTPAYQDIWLSRSEGPMDQMPDRMPDAPPDMATAPPLPALALSGDPVEPLLGRTYLPRKFKTCIAIPPHNDVDLYAHDLGLVAIAGPDGSLAGFNVLVGGGLSIEYRNQQTFPATAQPLGFVPLAWALACVISIVSVQRDWGDRDSTKYARTRYTLTRRGIDTLRAEVEHRMGAPFQPLRPFHFTHTAEAPGWLPTLNGQWQLTLFIDSGRIDDQQGHLVQTCLRKIAAIHRGRFQLTPQQNLVIAEVDSAHKAEIDALARQYGLLDEGITPVRMQALACVALPTCPLAIAEAERFLPAWLSKVETLMARHGLRDAPLTVRVAGCANSCSRTLLAEVGLLGRAAGRYNLYLGGHPRGDRLARLYRDNLDADQLLGILDGLLERWANSREPGEAFGDFVIRTGIIEAVSAEPGDFWRGHVFPVKSGLPGQSAPRAGTTASAHHPAPARTVQHPLSSHHGHTGKPADPAPEHPDTVPVVVPFNATLLRQQRITSRQAVTSIQHIELDLRGSRLRYQPGDRLVVHTEPPQSYWLSASQAEAGEAAHIIVPMPAPREEDHHGPGGQAVANTGQDTDQPTTSGTVAAATLAGTPFSSGQDTQGLIPVSIQHHPDCSLPPSGQTPVVLIGSGPGMGPLRAIMQQREAEHATGKHWLIYGHHSLNDDFLYQIDWLAWRKIGMLSRADLVWSADSHHEALLLDRIERQASRLWEWMQHDAHVYVFGTPAWEARVRRIFTAILQAPGRLNAEASHAWLSTHFFNGDAE